jgi:cytochrome P450
LARRYGDVVRLRLAGTTFYLISHPDAIEEVLRHQHRKFIKDRGTRMLSAFLRQGLLTSEGELWRRQRRLAQPAFQLEQVQKYGQVMVALTEDLLRDWKIGQTRDVHADMMRLTLRIAAQTLFGASVEGREVAVGQALEAIMKHYASFLVQLFPSLSRLPTPGQPALPAGARPAE